MNQMEIDAMSFDEKLAKLKRGIVIPPPQRVDRKLDLEKVAMIAIGYDTRNEFRMCDRTAYNWASRNNLMDLVCAHMEPAKRGPKSCAV